MAPGWPSGRHMASRSTFIPSWEGSGDNSWPAGNEGVSPPYTGRHPPQCQFPALEARSSDDGLGVIAGHSLAVHGLGAPTGRPADRVHHLASNLPCLCGPGRPLRQNSWLDPAPTGQVRVRSGEPAAPTWGCIGLASGLEAERRSPGATRKGHLLRGGMPGAVRGLGRSGEHRGVALQAPAFEHRGASGHQRLHHALAVAAALRRRCPFSLRLRVSHSSPEHGPAGFHFLCLGKENF